MAELFEHGPGFVHVDVMLYTSQGYLAPVAHSCYSNFEPKHSDSSPVCAPPGLVITPNYVGLAHPSAGLNKDVLMA